MHRTPARCVALVAVLLGTALRAGESAGPLPGEPLSPAQIDAGFADTMAAMVARDRDLSADDAGRTASSIVRLTRAAEWPQVLGPAGPGGLGTSPQLFSSFSGAVRGDAGQSGYPADAAGAIGPDQFVEVAHHHFQVLDRATGLRLVNVSLSAFFSPLTTRGLPRVLYDQHAGRWIVVSSNFDTDARLQVAVSRTSDAGPASQWFKFGFAANGGSDQGCWPDYPTLGVDAAGLYIATYMANCAMTVFAIEKAPLVAAVPAVGTITAFRGLPFEGAIQPAHSYGPGSGEYLVSRAGSTALRLRRIDPPLTAPTLVNLPNITIPAHAFPPAVPAAGSTTPLDTLDHRLLNAVYVGGALWTTHTIGLSGRAACRWYQIDPATSDLEQVGTIEDETVQYFFPAIAANARGDAALGFSGAHADQFVGAYLAARRASDSEGQMSVPLLYRAGVEAINFPDGQGRNRWGSYSLTTLDPRDALGFWTVQAYAHGLDVWGTHIAAFTYGDCNENGLDDACEVDCRRPGCDIPGCGSGSDCNANGILDSCELAAFDCDSNGVHDACDLLPGGSASDCNANGVPDACELAGADCNANGVPDECDLAWLQQQVSGPQESGACPGSTVVLAASGPAGSSYQWYRDGLPLADSATISGSHEAALTIAGMTAAEEGAYACRVAQGCLAVETTPAMLHLLPTSLAVVQEPVQQVTVCVTGTAGAAFEFRVDQTYGTHFQWFRDGQALADDGRIQGAQSGRLRLTPVAPSDAGRYTCQASNACGAAVSSGTGRGLLVAAGTVFESAPQPTCADAAGRAAFRARVDSSPGTLYFWYRQDEFLVDGSDALGMEIEGAATPELVLDAIPPAYDGHSFKLVTLTNAPVCLGESPPATLAVGGCGPCRFRGDLDGDLDVDLVDLAWFARCFGPAAPAPSPCVCGDVAGADEIIDLADWQALETLLSGPR